MVMCRINNNNTRKLNEGGGSLHITVVVTGTRVALYTTLSAALITILPNLTKKNNFQNSHKRTLVMENSVLFSKIKRTFINLYEIL